MSRKKWIQEIDPVRKPSKYSILEGQDFFLISAINRVPTLVKIYETSFSVGKAVDATTPEFPQGASPQVFGFYCFPEIVNAVATTLMLNWERPKRKNKKKEDPDWGISSWAEKQTKIALLGKISTQWRRLLAGADPTIVSAQKAVFSASGHPTANHMLDAKLYEDRILIKDVLSSRGAATLLHYAPFVITKMNAARVRAMPEWADMEQLAESLGLRIDLSSADVKTEEIIESMHNWAGMLAPSGKPYCSLSATLINLPKNVPFEFVFDLAQHKLLEPITSRSAVLLAGAYASFEKVCGLADADKQKLQNIFFRTKDIEIKKAMALFNDHTGFAFSIRRYRDVDKLIKYMLDAPIGRSKTLVGFLKAAIRYHQEKVEEERIAYAATADIRRVATKPPIPLPAEPDITFLETVNTIISEGELMGHCVGSSSYCEGAVNGTHYLFHVRHSGHDATAQIMADGTIGQIFGPKNKNNPACKWGISKLSPWCRQLKRHLREGVCVQNPTPELAFPQMQDPAANVFERAQI